MDGFTLLDNLQDNVALRRELFESIVLLSKFGPSGRHKIPCIQNINDVNINI